jgi:1,4-dihydroxy-2-naphthoate octaprenyltransferase
MQTLYVIAWIAFMVCMFLVWFFWHRANHKERVMKIEKGFDPDEQAKNNSGSQSRWLKVGILIIGLSIGLLLISLLMSLKLLSNGGDAFPLAILGMCGGIAMVIGNKIKSGKSND